MLLLLVVSTLGACGSDEFVSQGICRKCSLNCAACSEQNFLCTACAANYYLSGTTCRPCAYKCAICESSNKCTICQDGSTPTSDNLIPCGDPSKSDIPIRDACFIILIVAVVSTFMYMVYNWFCYREKSVPKAQETDVNRQTTSSQSPDPTVRHEMKPLLPIPIQSGQPGMIYNPVPGGNPNPVPRRSINGGPQVLHRPPH